MKEKIINQIGNWNPQLLREIKGRIKPQNLTLTVIISLIAQFLTFIFLQGKLPKSYDTYHRYCVGIPPADAYHDSYYGGYMGNNYCVRDSLGNIVHLFHQLWWLDLFIALSMVGIFVLLVGGTYLLIADLSKEENKGTLNFIRLSPQSPKNIFLGKILGVPILLYLGCLLAIPLHLTTGILAHISVPLIFVFYLVTIFSCFFFYQAALLFGLVSSTLMGFQSFLGSGIVLFFLSCATGIMLTGDMIIHNPVDWLTLFDPAIILAFVIDSTKIQPDTINYLKLKDLQELQFYGQYLWQNLWSTLAFMIFNYGIWTYWLSQGLKRRFHNPLTTLITKRQSYLITACFMVMNLGFILQFSPQYYSWNESLAVGLFLNLVLFLILTAALSPHRQELQDWVRYRHQDRQYRSLLKDLIWGEKSPSTVAIVLNITMVIVYFIPTILLFDINQENKSALLWGMIFGGTIALLYATIAQFILYQKTNKRGLFAVLSVTTMVILPYVILGIFNLDPQDHWLWLFTMLPIAATEHYLTDILLFSLITQVLAIAVFNYQMKKQLKKAGESETKALLTN